MISWKLSSLSLYLLTNEARSRGDILNIFFILFFSLYKEVSSDIFNISLLIKNKNIYIIFEGKNKIYEIIKNLNKINYLIIFY